ncbi:MAG TPA: tetratricopeptide repeat protein [Salinivirgaceae bacterium]|nr:tetratricopeptide repeat protein [Salinivirgaceae bacterium]
MKPLFSNAILRLLPLLLLMIIMHNCGKKNNEKREFLQKIVKTEQELDSIRRIRPDEKEKTYELIGYYIQFSETYKTDSAAPVFLYRAAENSLYINQPLQSINYLKQIENDYPHFPNLGNVLFLIGFTYENNLRNIVDARIYYERFIQKFPDHPLAADTKILLQNLGKTPEELIKQFEANKNQ